MQPPIELEAAVLARLFSNTYRFTLPWFQRAYAWTDEHAARLLDDVAEAAKTDQWYHLGAIIVTEGKKTTLPDGEEEFEVSIIDGQQRITTLTILFAVLRDLIDDTQHSRSLDERIWLFSAGEKDPKARLLPQASIGNVLHDYVQAGKTALREPEKDAAGAFNESQSRVIDNRDALRKLLEPLKQDELLRIAGHLQNRCYVVIERFQNAQTAERVFTNAQERGLRLAPTDLFKVSVLNHVPVSSRDDCAEVWDKWAAALGNEGLAALLSYMRDIKVQKKMKAPVEKELLEHYRIQENAERFVLEEFAPMAELFLNVRRFWFRGGAAHGQG